MKKIVANVFDFGSSKINAFVGSYGSTGNLVIYGQASCNYAGFSDCEFFEKDKLVDVIGKVLEEVELKSRHTIKELTIGVPAEFVNVETRKINVTFVNKKRLTENLLNEIYKKAFIHVDGYTIVGVQSLYNVIDGGKLILNAENERTSKITSMISVNYVKNEFIELVNKTLKKLGIVKVDYVASQASQTRYLFKNKYERAILVDVGYLTSSISQFQGEGLRNLASFSLGGAYISADLSECLDISFEEAEDLKEKLILTLRPTLCDYYELEVGGRIKQIATNKANEIAIARIEMIGDCIVKCLETFDIDEEIPIFLTGGGISYIKGAKKLISRKLNKKVEVILPSLAEFNKTHYSSQLGLLDFALFQKFKKNKRILAKLIYS